MRLFLLSILFSAKIFAQGDSCSFPTCSPGMTNSDYQQYCKLQQILNAIRANGSGGGGGGLQQSTLDSINAASYNSAGHSQSFLLGDIITILNQINNSTLGENDSLHQLILNTVPINLALTYTVISSAATNTITAGARKVDIANSGAEAAQINGVTFPAGATISFTYPQAILPQITYNCLTSILIISILR